MRQGIIWDKSGLSRGMVSAKALGCILGDEEERSRGWGQGDDWTDPCGHHKGFSRSKTGPIRGFSTQQLCDLACSEKSTLTDVLSTD